jgi:hypothetical protein
MIDCRVQPRQPAIPGAMAAPDQTLSRSLIRTGAKISTIIKLGDHKHA